MATKKAQTYYAVTVAALGTELPTTIYGPFVANDPGEAVTLAWHAIVTGKGTKSGPSWTENRRAFRKHVKAGGCLQLTVSNSAVELETLTKGGAAVAAAAGMTAAAGK
jgi:hypothetical protein